MNIEQGSTTLKLRRLKLTNRELRSEYLLHKSYIDIPCSEIDLQLANKNKEKKSSRGATPLTPSTRWGFCFYRIKLLILRISIFNGEEGKEEK
jgi:hypothetical protein